MANIDLLIHGAKIVDGTGNPWFYGDVVVTGEQIAEITPPGKISPKLANEVVDASEMIVCPGFIDIQSHSIAPLMLDGRCVSKITQGITSEIMGESWTPAPYSENIENTLEFGAFADRLPEWIERAKTWRRFGNWLEFMMTTGVSPNIGSFLGGGTLRRYVKGMEVGPPTPDELMLMQRVMAEAMEDGAFGVSYALIYPPDAYTETEELIAVCKVVSRYNGSYITHLRSEADEIFSALEEAFQVGRQANLPVEIYHLKTAGRRNWPKMPQVIARIDQARATGLDVTADMYPYHASSTGLASLLPAWAEAGNALFENLRNPEIRNKIRKAMVRPDDVEEMGDALHGNDVMPVGFQKSENRQYAGKRLSEIASSRGQDWVETVFDLLLSEEQRISTIYFSMTEENVRLQLQQPWIKIATDAGGLDPIWGQELGPIHPRAYGTYPRVLGRYVREQKILNLEDAIRKMTSAVAHRLGLCDRGYLQRGMFADIVIFNPETIGDRATFETPHQLSTGVRDVWVNGTRVVEKGEHTGATPGKILRNPG
jgi:dihydroorotase/N-acyl-D-amino-acid deacylase